MNFKKSNYAQALIPSNSIKFPLLLKSALHWPPLERISYFQTKGRGKGFILYPFFLNLFVDDLFNVPINLPSGYHTQADASEIGILISTGFSHMVQILLSCVSQSGSDNMYT